MGRLPTLAPRRACAIATARSVVHLPRPSQPSTCIQVRHATFIPRPRRPYTFTQLVQLSDGSTYTARTTSPLPLYRTAKDTRNTLLWQPSEKSLRNVELDEAGKLAAFRERFGRGFDASVDAAADAGAGEDAVGSENADDTRDVLADLISGYASQESNSMRDSGPKKAATRRK
ncbi:50S ribosomal protein L36 [Drechmeria coniospora]|uniref:50S ribosomal protein L36 n=1 Tax=Drechmeria coniospora TaxID=98403 RepID=A0A151GJ78_DRECN|nr:50S ribosomal protein L36 [Drechmeria coniospora]KYK57091.1 50S ribosomal protein L36 [Drechmeria coniospora]ODA78994.1 hypothetical protein RJ55_04584 [Drechmeria coniospora]